MPVTRWFDQLGQDVRMGLRQLAASPGFAAVAILLLALGIGANAAVFGVLKSVLLDSLPYADADRLVRINGGVRSTPQIGPLTAATVTEIRARQRSFIATAAWDGRSDVVVNAGEGPRIAQRSWVEPQLFETLGVAPALGRTFRTEDAISGVAALSGGQVTPDTASVTIISDRAWRELLVADPNVLGKPVRINGIARTVIGVLPSTFVGPMGEVDFFLPMDIEPAAVHPIFGRGTGWLGMVARMAPGVTPDAARREVATIWQTFAQRYPAESASLGIDTVPLRDAMAGDTRAPLLVLIASAALVLLTTCANLGAALLSRAISRRKEFAVRLALGADRRRLVRQMLTESLLIAVAGGVAGLVTASMLLEMVRALPVPVLPAYADLTLDRGTLLVMAVVALATGLLFGAAPAVMAGSRRIGGSLQAESRGASEGRASGRLRGLLVAGQLALCVSLLAGAGLLARSLWAMASTPIGVQTGGVLSAGLQLPAASYPTPAAIGAFQLRVLDRLQQLPGVERVALTSALPTTDIGQLGFTIEGAPAPPDGQPFALAAMATDDYFRLLGVPLRAGRTFDAREHPGTAGVPVVVINESMARRYWPAGNAVGAHVRLGPNQSAPWTDVIGIVGDVRNDLARADAAPMVFLPIRQAARPNMRLLLRVSGNPEALIPSLQRAVRELDPELPLKDAMSLDAVIDRGLASRRVPVLLMIAFGGLALLLASVGVYAMFSNMTTAREREFGVRMALGSRPGQIAGLVLRHGAIWIGGGLGAGVVGIAAMVPLIQGLLYGVEPFDPLTLGGAIVVLVLSALLALVVPLRRATTVDPAIALRA
jgi:predicted permease